MENIDLVIFSADTDYSLALGEALSVLKNNFIVRICDEEAISGIQKFDLLLMDQPEHPGDNPENDKGVIWLTDFAAQIKKDIEPLNFVLYKYARADELAADILLYYSLLTGKTAFVHPDSQSRILLFCGGKGGVGKTTVALGTGQALRRYYSKSVLYISMEEVESTLMYFEAGDKTCGICEYLYHFFKNEGHGFEAEAFTIYDKYGICAFKPDRGKNIIRELDYEKTMLFFKRLMESGAYDYILVDMGESFGQETKWIFHACHKAVVVLSPEMCERENRFVNYLRFASGDEEENIVMVHNKVTETEASETDERVYIDFDAESIRCLGEMFEISIDQDFGSGIKELTKKII